MTDSLTRLTHKISDTLFFRVSGPLEERVAQVNTILRQYHKFSNVLDIR